MRLLIQGGHIVNEGRVFSGSIVVEDGKIFEVVIIIHPAFAFYGMIELYITQSLFVILFSAEKAIIFQEA